MMLKIVFFCVQDSSPPESQSPFKFPELNPTCLSTGQDYSKEKSYFALWPPHWETKRQWSSAAVFHKHTHTPTTCGTTLKKKTPRLQWHNNGFRFNFNGTKTTNHCYIHIFNIKFCCICSWAFVCKDNERHETAKNMWIFHFVEMEEHKSMWLFIDDLISGLWVRIHTVCHRGENASVCPLIFIYFFRDTHYKDEAQVNPQRIQLTVHNIVSIKEQQPLCEYVAVLCVRVRTKTIAGFRLMFWRLCLIIYNC